MPSDGVVRAYEEGGALLIPTAHEFVMQSPSHAPAETRRFDVLSALKDGDSLHAARGIRSVRVGYRFAARCRDESRSYLRSTVV